MQIKHWNYKCVDTLLTRDFIGNCHRVTFAMWPTVPVKQISLIFFSRPTACFCNSVTRKIKVARLVNKIRDHTYEVSLSWEDNDSIKRLIQNTANNIKWRLDWYWTRTTSELFHFQWKTAKIRRETRRS